MSKNSKTKDNKINERFIEGNEIKLLEFELKDKKNKIYTLALNIQKIKEVVDFIKLDELPDVFDPFIGVYNLRGTPIPVLNLLKFFSHNENVLPPTSNDRIIICDFQRLLVGIIVSKTKAVRTYSNSEVMAQPEALDQTQKHFFNGIVQREGKIINLLDIEFILHSLDIDLGSKSIIELSEKFEQKKVLILEDSKFFQKKTDAFFLKMGFETVLVGDGQAGLDALERYNYNFDVIFSDIEMPILNGIGFARKVKEMERGRRIPIIFNTSLSNPTLRDDIESEKLGVYIVKFDEQSIFEQISKIVDTNYKPEKIAKKKLTGDIKVEKAAA